MSLTPEHAARLRNWRVPRMSQDYTARDAALYALTIGFGDDPLDRDELRYVDHTLGNFRVAPSFALILGYPGFWLGDPATGIEIGRILHIEQSVEILTPLAPAGRVTGETSVTDLLDLGAGKGAVLRSRRDIRDADDRLIAVVRQSHMLLGYGGFGGERPAKSAAEKLGQPAWTVKTKALPQQALLYRLNGDLNPIHADPDLAAISGFEKPILHGMCSFGMTCRAILRSLCAYEPARLRFISARMTAPVFPGETLRHDIHPGGFFTATVVERDKVALDHGSAVILNDRSERTLLPQPLPTSQRKEA
ncbi:MaoC/PaaZ C-terminal domain-containing protein [Mesorhizobium sp. 1B3]|uniref:MaoC/PaaZ C-terminal domain-containing protein n=1 Tax=Mesorhizobium sp. 1B3 TaxID=3243599 RepID=UPI003D95ECB5